MASSLHDLPTDLMGAHHPLPFERFRPGMCYELRFNTQVIRRGLIMYDTTATVTFAFYPSHFSSKLVRGELPVGHSFYEALPVSRHDQVEIHPLGHLFSAFVQTLPFALKTYFGVQRTEPVRTPRAETDSEKKKDAVTNSVSDCVHAPKKKRRATSTPMQEFHPLIIAEDASGIVWGPDIEVVTQDNYPIDLPPDITTRKPQERKARAPVPPVNQAPVPLSTSLPAHDLQRISASLEESSRSLHGVSVSVGALMKALRSIPEIPF